MEILGLLNREQLGHCKASDRLHVDKVRVCVLKVTLVLNRCPRG